MNNKLPLSAAFICLLGACSIPAPLPPAALPASTSAVQVDRLWSTNLSSSLAYLHYKTSIAIDADTVYACSNRRLSALDKASGAIIWQKVNSAAYSACLNLQDQRLYVGDSHGELSALNTSGDVLWSERLSAGLYHLPLIGADKLLALSEDSQLHLLNASTGARILTLPGRRPQFSLQGASAPAYSTSQAFYSLGGNVVTAMQLSNGQLNWEQELSGVPDSGSGVSAIEQIRANLQYSDQRVYALPYQGRMAALDAQSGAIIWEKELSSSRDFLLTGDDIYLFDNDATLTKLAATTGVEAWRAPELANRDFTAPVLLQSLVLAADAYGYLHFFAAEDGSYLDTQRISPYAVRSLTVVGNEVYALDAKGWLQSLAVNP